MSMNKKHSRIVAGSLLTLLACSVVSSVGCTVNSNGMNLPSPYYMLDRPEYHPRGPEFPFANEAANLQKSAQQ